MPQLAPHRLDDSCGYRNGRDLGENVSLFADYESGAHLRVAQIDHREADLPSVLHTFSNAPQVLAATHVV
jgi:hypothetical protein